MTPGASVPARPTVAATCGKAFTDDADLSMLNDQRITTLRPDRVGVVDQASRPCNANSPELVGAGSAGHAENEVQHPSMNMPRPARGDLQREVRP